MCCLHLCACFFLSQEIVSLAGGKEREGEIKSVSLLQAIELYFLLALLRRGEMECIPSSGAII